MSLTRDDMLNELELLPVWQQRNVSKPAENQVIPQTATEHAFVIEATPPIKSVEAMPALVVEESSIETAVAATENLITEEPGSEKTLTYDRPATIMKMDWSSLQACVPECTACSLAATRIQTVFGVGDPNADWLIIGEAPGAEEDRKGEPFVGQAGKLLDNMLAAIQLKRGSNVYIANVLKCRPPENRDPHGEEVLQCDPFLKRQVELIKPKLILALGKFAAQSLLASDNTIASMRGKLHDYHGVPVIVTYHPAYLLRNLPDKAKAWEDLCMARKTMANLQSGELPPSI
ncbi:MAG TPA: uracil-DNA glycosylase [Methylophilaceae bacterium]|nr:uracil-DNA glycosylase [Methylophilaceae bacterium]